MQKRGGFQAETITGFEFESLIQDKGGNRERKRGSCSLKQKACLNESHSYEIELPVGKRSQREEKGGKIVAEYDRLACIRSRLGGLKGLKGARGRAINSFDEKKVEPVGEERKKLLSKKH